MNVSQAMQVLHDVAWRFDVEPVLNEVGEGAGAEYLFSIGELLGLSRKDLENGVSPIPDTLEKAYPIFDLIEQWNFAEQLTEKFGPFRVLRAIFGEQYNGPDVPTKEEENQMILAAVRPRCDLKALKINEVFPGTYPLELPFWKFSVSTSSFRSFEKVHELADAYEQVLERYATLFFTAVHKGLPENEAQEFNLLSTFLNASDVVMPSQRMTYQHVEKYRKAFQEENFQQLSSYVRIRRVLPVWKAREFYSNPDYVAHYIATHEDAKAQIRAFLSSVSTYECRYTFINNMKEHLYRQSLSEEELEAYDYNRMMMDDDDDSPPTYVQSEPVIVDKAEDEISETDRLIVERGKSMVKSVRFGGVLPMVKREPYNSIERLSKRLGLQMFEPSPEDIQLDDLTELMEAGDFE